MKRYNSDSQLSLRNRAIKRRNIYKPIHKDEVFRKPRNYKYAWKDKLIMTWYETQSCILGISIALMFIVIMPLIICPYVIEYIYQNYIAPSYTNRPLTLEQNNQLANEVRIAFYGIYILFAVMFIYINEIARFCDSIGVGCLKIMAYPLTYNMGNGYVDYLMKKSNEKKNGFIFKIYRKILILN